MRFSSYALTALAANLAAALPRPQDIDLDMVLAAPDPTFSEAVATAAVTSVSVEVSDVLSQTAIATNAKRAASTTCAPQPTGAASAPTYSAGADNAANFLANTYYASVASAAPVPSGYTRSFVAQQASNNAFGYQGFDTLDTYDVATCAQRCTANYGCVSFNIYFERDPSVNPDDTSCSNPSSVTMIKCVYWGGQVTLDNAVNKGQMRGGFTVAIAGSNGYVTTQIATPDGYQNGVPFGKFAINAPYDAQGYNTYMGAKIFTGTWDVSQCSKYCDAQTKYNNATAPKDGTPAKVCKFFNTYLLQAKLANGTIAPQGQYCSLYTEAWPVKYATNGGQWRGKDQYTVDYSFGYAANPSSSDIDPIQGDVKGATYQAVADIKWSSLQPFCSTYLRYTIPLSTTTATATLTPTVTSTSYSTTTVPAMGKRDDTNSTFPGLTTDSSVGVAVLIDNNNVTWYDPRFSAARSGISALTKRDVPAVAIPTGLAKYQSAVISAACSMQVMPASQTSVVTASATVTGSATTTIVTVASTATASPSSIDNIIVAVAGATWSVPGYPQGSSPLEFASIGFSQYAFQPYGFVNLHNDRFISRDAVHASFSFDSTTGYLSTFANGTTLIASAYNGYISDATRNFVIFHPAADIAQYGDYAPLSCTISANGQLSCSIQSRTSNVVASHLMVTGDDANVAGVLTIAVDQVYNGGYYGFHHATVTLTS